MISKSSIQFNSHTWYTCLTEGCLLLCRQASTIDKVYQQLQYNNTRTNNNMQARKPTAKAAAAAEAATADEDDRNADDEDGKFNDMMKRANNETQTLFKGYG